MLAANVLASDTPQIITSFHAASTPAQIVVGRFFFIHQAQAVRDSMPGGPVTGRELFPDGSFPAADWRRHAMLWRSQFTAEGWKNLTAALRLQRIWHVGDREICVSLEPWDPPRIDSFWTSKIPPNGEMRKVHGWRYIFIGDLRKESYFSCDTMDDIVWHALEPIVLEMDLHDREDDYDVEATTAFSVLSGEQAVSVTHAMTKLWLTSSRPAGIEELQQTYEDCLAVIEGSRPDEHTESRNSYFARVPPTARCRLRPAPGRIPHQDTRSFQGIHPSGDIPKRPPNNTALGNSGI